MIFKINNKNKEKTTGISRDDKKAVLMVRPTFNKYESSQISGFESQPGRTSFTFKLTGN